MLSAHNEGKHCISEGFIRTFKNNCNRMTSVSKNVYIDKFDDIVNKYNNTYYSTIKMEAVNLKSSTYIDSKKEINGKQHKFKVGDTARISKHKNIFVKGYVSNWSEKVFVIKKVKNTVYLTYIIKDLKGEENVAAFYEKGTAKKNQKEFRVENVLKRKDIKLYVEWKGYHCSLNSWIDKKFV